MAVIQNVDFAAAVRSSPDHAAMNPASLNAASLGPRAIVPDARRQAWAPVAGCIAASGHGDDERLPVGVAAALIIMLSLGLWALILTAGLWVIRVT